MADDPELGTILHQQGLGLHRVVLREVGLDSGRASSMSRVRLEEVQSSMTSRSCVKLTA